MTPIPATASALASPPPDTFDPDAWPFHRPGVNPVARETPPGMHRHAADWLRNAAGERVLVNALRAHPGYHRFGDALVGVVWRRNGELLYTKPAYSPVSFSSTDGATIP